MRCWGEHMINLDDFLHDCRSAVRAGQSETLALVRSALADPEAFAAAVMDRPQPWFFLADDDLTVFCTNAPPGSASAPHDHATWSVLGCFVGAEESWHHRRADDGSLQTTGSTVLRPGDAHALPGNAIHSVMNRWDQPNGVVHIYAGNFVELDRTVWDPVTHQSHPAGLGEMVAPLTTDRSDPATKRADEGRAPRDLS